jgi:hypothetical protein
MTWPAELHYDSFIMHTSRRDYYGDGTAGWTIGREVGMTSLAMSQNSPNPAGGESSKIEPSVQPGSAAMRQYDA